MSATQATTLTSAPSTARPDAAPGAARPHGRTRLQVVRAPAHTRTRVPFVVLCMSVLTAALLGTLLLNTAMAQGEYERFALQSRLAQSAQRQQQVAGEIAHAESSPQLAAAARSLGMIPAGNGGYLRLADGAVLGEPTPAGTGG